MPWILGMRDGVLRMTWVTEEVVVSFTKVRKLEKDQIWDLKTVGARVKISSFNIWRFERPLRKPRGNAK